MLGLLARTGRPGLTKKARAPQSPAALLPPFGPSRRSFACPPIGQIARSFCVALQEPRPAPSNKHPRALFFVHNARRNAACRRRLHREAAQDRGTDPTDGAKKVDQRRLSCGSPLIRPTIQLHAHLTGSIGRHCLHQIWLTKKDHDPELDMEDPMVAIPPNKVDYDLNTYAFTMCPILDARHPLSIICVARPSAPES